MDEFTQLAHQAGIGALAVYALQWIKNSKWFPWISKESVNLNRWIGMLIALGTSLGIKYAVQAASGGGYHIVLDVPNLGVLLDTAVHAAAQFAGQQVLYHTAVAKSDAVVVEGNK